MKDLIVCLKIKKNLNNICSMHRWDLLQIISLVHFKLSIIISYRTTHRYLDIIFNECCYILLSVTLRLKTYVGANVNTVSLFKNDR